MWPIIKDKTNEREQLLGALRSFPNNGDSNIKKKYENFSEFTQDIKDYINNLLEQIQKVIKNRHFYSSSLPLLKKIETVLKNIQKIFAKSCIYADDLEKCATYAFNLSYLDYNSDTIFGKSSYKVKTNKSIINDDVLSAFRELGNVLLQGIQISQRSWANDLLKELEHCIKNLPNLKPVQKRLLHMSKQKEDIFPNFKSDFMVESDYIHYIIHIAKNKLGYGQDVIKTIHYTDYICQLDILSSCKLNDTLDNDTFKSVKEKTKELLKTVEDRKFNCRGCGTPSNIFNLAAVQNRTRNWAYHAVCSECIYQKILELKEEYIYRRTDPFARYPYYQDDIIRKYGRD